MHPVQTESPANGEPRLKVDLTQIPVHNKDALEVRPKLMVGSRGRSGDSGKLNLEGMPVQAKPAIGQGEDKSSQEASRVLMVGKESETVRPLSRQPEFRGLSSELISERVGGKSDRSTPVQRQEEGKKAENKTGLPDRLKEGIESMSGYDLSGVRVNYNSQKPAQLNAHAYTQGHVIEVAPGQERHLPHEAWHVVQQMQDRVRATVHLKDNVLVNDEDHLEKEADAMGKKALLTHNFPREALGHHQSKKSFNHIIQRVQVSIALEDQQIVTELANGYYKLLDSNSYIHAEQVKNDRVSSDISRYVTAYLQGNLTLYRGMPSWHPAWFSVFQKNSIPPLGSGELPDFETQKTSFIPFSPNRTIAVSAAMSRSGMGPGDQIEAVSNLSHHDAEARGAVLSVTIGPGTPVAFYNDGEIQVKGPINEFEIDRIQMGNPLTEVYNEPSLGEQQVRDITPLFSNAEASSYRKKFGSLRHEDIKVIYAMVDENNRFAPIVRQITDEAETYFRKSVVPETGVNETAGYTQEKKNELAMQSTLYAARIRAVQQIGAKITEYLNGDDTVAEKRRKRLNVENVFLPQILSSHRPQKIDGSSVLGLLNYC
ncbi:MAG: DUF4157 domain-containing protein [Hormoscilla sp. GUM202]|nr:DUF4157 domain-containing protein [Hormoscilla sp. GUM202]